MWWPALDDPKVKDPWDKVERAASARRAKGEPEPELDLQKKLQTEPEKPLPE